MVPDPDLTKLRAILNVRRHEAGLTCEQLSEASGLSRQTLLNISSGRYHGDLRSWLKLSRVFDISIDDMLRDVWLESH
ncbi:helix-turn-helix transcriptional regulator [Microbacterium sp. GXS0129]|uniref:helix-turn-helix transcriptional regulator n=1 Tax=Microbacterium sp. GXS0129 TaxID=3377836 RepID=UPI003839CFDE